jgi:hypothetical protein
MTGVIALIGTVLFWIIACVICEIVGYPIQKILIEPDKVTDPLWKRSLRVLVMISIAGFFIAVSMMWQLGR